MQGLTLSFRTRRLGGDAIRRVRLVPGLRAIALEAHARDWNVATLRLNSTLTARHFYERCGFATAGDPTPSFGLVRGYPYTKAL